MAGPQNVTEPQPTGQSVSTAQSEPEPHWLNKFCRVDPTTRTAWMATPFVSGPWMVATDSIAMIGIDSFDYKGTFGDGPKDPDTIDTVAAYVSEVNAPGTEADGDKFREFIGPWREPEWIVCPACNGELEVDHECDCNLCEVDDEPCRACMDAKGVSTGKVLEEMPERYYRVLGMVLNCNRLAKILHYLPKEPTYRIASVKVPKAAKKEKETDTLLIRNAAGDGVNWFVRIASMTDDTEVTGGREWK